MPEIVRLSDRSVAQVRLMLARPEAAVRALTGRFPDGRHYNRVIDRDADVWKPDGSLLFALRRGALPAAAVRPAWEPLKRAARPTHRRTTAAGGAITFRSGLAGYYKGRATRYTLEDPEGWRAVALLAREMDAVFRQFADQYAVLLDVAGRTLPGLLISGTRFTTVTINRNARMAVHRNGGNLIGAYGALGFVRAGSFTGGELVWPGYGVAVAPESCDVLIADNREPHGMTAIVGADGDYERVSLVCYFHASNLTS